jgi:hypothetical protein
MEGLMPDACGAVSKYGLCGHAVGGKGGWHVVAPSTVYLENWHIDLIAEYLEAVTAGQIKRLLINMPPRYAKSTCVSIMWPTWVWAREGFPGKPHNPVLEGPGTRWLFASYADELRTKHSLDRRKLLQSDWYRAAEAGATAAEHSVHCSVAVFEPERRSAAGLLQRRYCRPVNQLPLADSRPLCDRAQLQLWLQGQERTGATDR